MEKTTSITTTYAGEFAGKYIAAALLSSKTLEDGAITIKPNVKYKEVIKKVATDSNVIKDATCDFADTATVTLTERILQPEEFQVNLELCKKDFRSDWEAIEMGYSAFDSLPPSFSDFIISHVAGLVAEKNEQNIWGGVNATAGEFDGFTTLMAADADVNDAANGAETSFSSSNIITLLGNTVDALPSTVIGQEDHNIYVPTVAFQAYFRALGSFAIVKRGTGYTAGVSDIGPNVLNNAGTTWYNGGNLSFDGVKIFVANGLADNNAVAAQKSNLFFGTGLLEDHNEVRLIDTSETLGDANVRLIMRYTAGAQVGVTQDCVLYN